MSRIETAQEIIAAYERHGWKLRRILLRPASRDEFKSSADAFPGAALIDAEIDAAERLSGAPSKRVFDQALAGVLRMHGLGRQTIEVGPLSHSHDRVFLVVKDRDISASTVTEVRKELSVTLGAMLGHHVKVIELHRRESTVMPRRTEEPSGEDS